MTLSLTHLQIDREPAALGWLLFVMAAVFLVGQSAPLLGQQTAPSEIPEWVAEILSGDEPAPPIATVTGRHAAHGAAQDELRQMLVMKVDRWLKTQPESERLRLTLVDWDVVSGLVLPGEMWIGRVAPDPAGESVNQEWIGVARVELKTSLLEKAESLVISRTILSRAETAMLAMAGVTGTVGIVWFSLLLDHKTRHHFSRRFQMLAAVTWVAMGVAIFFVWRMVLT